RPAGRASDSTSAMRSAFCIRALNRPSRLDLCPARCYNARASQPPTFRRFCMTRRTRRHFGFLLAVIVLTLTALAAVTYGQSGEYKVGVLEPLTGPLAAEGKRHLEGFEIVRDMINERGGVMGKKLTFVVADAPDPTAAASEANRLITREGVKIVTGTFSSRLCGAAGEAGGGPSQRHLLGDLVRGSALQQARAQDGVPHGDRRHRLRLVQHRVHRQAPRSPLQPEAQPAQDCVPLRGLLLRPGRDRIRVGPR